MHWFKSSPQTIIRSLVGSLQEPVGSASLHGINGSSILEDILRPQNLLQRVARQSFRKDSAKFASPKYVRKYPQEELHDFARNSINAEDGTDTIQDEDAETHFKLDLTALFVINALGGRSVVLKRTPTALWRYRIVHSNVWRVIFAITSVTNLALALIEEPMYKPQETANWLCPTPVSRG